MTPEVLRNVLEAAMLAAGRALSIDDFVALFEGSLDAPDRDTLRQALEALDASLADRPLELVEVASGFRLQVRREYSGWLGGLFAERAPRYSRALLETLALIAYRQPITRGEIEDVRGVAVSTNIMKTLLEREWVRVLGHREVPGRPALYGTTREFLDHFGLKGLDGLPSLAEIRDLDQVEPDLFASAAAGGAAPGAGADPGDGERSGPLAQHDADPAPGTGDDEFPDLDGDEDPFPDRDGGLGHAHADGDDALDLGGDPGVAAEDRDDVGAPARPGRDEDGGSGARDA